MSQQIDYRRIERAVMRGVMLGIMWLFLLLIALAFSAGLFFESVRNWLQTL